MRVEGCTDCWWLEILNLEGLGVCLRVGFRATSWGCDWSAHTVLGKHMFRTRHGIFREMVSGWTCRGFLVIMYSLEILLVVGTVVGRKKITITMPIILLLIPY